MEHVVKLSQHMQLNVSARTMGTEWNAPCDLAVFVALFVLRSIAPRLFWTLMRSIMLVWSALNW